MENTGLIFMHKNLENCLKKNEFSSQWHSGGQTFPQKESRCYCQKKEKRADKSITSMVLCTQCVDVTRSRGHLTHEEMWGKRRLNSRGCRTVLSSTESQSPAVAACREDVKGPGLELMRILPEDFYWSSGELTPRIGSQSLGRFVFPSDAGSQGDVWWIDGIVANSFRGGHAVPMSQSQGPSRAVHVPLS